MERKSLGNFIALLRKEKNLTQKQLAELLNVSDKTVSHWECDETSPDISLLPELAELLGVTVDELLKGEKMAPQPSVEHHYIPSENNGFLDKVENFASKTADKIKNKMNGDESERYRCFCILSGIGTIFALVALLKIGLTTLFTDYYFYGSSPVAIVAFLGSLRTIALSLCFSLGARIYFAKELRPTEERDKKRAKYIYKANGFTYNNLFLAGCCLPLTLAGIEILAPIALLIALAAIIIISRLVISSILLKKKLIKRSPKATLIIRHLVACVLCVGIITGSAIFITEAYYPSVDNIIFHSAEEFIAYMETPKAKPDNAWELDGVTASTFPPTTMLNPNEATDNADTPESPVRVPPQYVEQEEIGETVMGYCAETYVTFRHLNGEVYDYAFNDDEGTFHVITYEAKIAQNKKMDLINDGVPIVASLLCVVVITGLGVSFCRKRKEIK